MTLPMEATFVKLTAVIYLLTAASYFYFVFRKDTASKLPALALASGLVLHTAALIVRFANEGFAAVALMGEALEADAWVLVHDAARPCLPRRDLDSLVRETENDEVGGILALPVAETVKKVAKDEAGAQRISRTEDRSQLWLAQTPQMFRAGLLMQALQRAKGTPTDEAAAVEQLGLKPRLVAGSRENLKVTWHGDLAIAESILKARA